LVREVSRRICYGQRERALCSLGMMIGAALDILSVLAVQNRTVSREDFDHVRPSRGREGLFVPLFFEFYLVTFYQSVGALAYHRG
jgi:hypothetical protein